MLNKKFWMLLVISESDRVKWRRRFICKCDCGNEKIVRMESLNNWNCRSCWCLRKRVTSERITTHWMSKSRIYAIRWYMRNRCENKKYKEYRYYWWRWIKCESRRKSFEEFYKDMWPTYQEWLSIDRIDVNWNYCKENCKWSNNIEQANNKRNNHTIQYNWNTFTLSQLARKYNISPKLLELRLRRWRIVEDALFTPIRNRWK